MFSGVTTTSVFYNIDMKIECLRTDIFFLEESLIELSMAKKISLVFLGFWIFCFHFGCLCNMWVFVFRMHSLIQKFIFWGFFIRSDSYEIFFVFQFGTLGLLLHAQKLSGSPLGSVWRILANAICWTHFLAPSIFLNRVRKLLYVRWSSTSSYDQFWLCLSCLISPSPPDHV